MATFLPNITDVFPESSNYTPDWNRIERSLRLKEKMYNEGAKRVKTMYDSLFSSAMLRDGNIKTRDSYLKTITDGLNRISAMDLSLPQNQQMAIDLFTPVLEDKNLVKDIAYTKQYQDELSKADQYRTSSDGEVRKQYWDVGIKALNYQAEEFKNADNQTAMSMSAPRYVRQVDIRALSEKAYKDAGISVKQDIISGGYIWTKKNGDVVFPISKNFVEILFSQDPAIKDMLQTQAYVERKDTVKQLAPKYGGEDKAERFYLTEVIKNAGQNAQQKLDDNSKELKDLRLKKESWDKIIKDRGIIPGSDEHKKYLEDLEKLKIAETGVALQNSMLLPTQTIDFNNIDDLRRQADNLVMFSNYSLLVNQIASLLSTKDAEVTVKVDPISLARLNSSLSLRNQEIMQSIRNADRKEQEKTAHEYRMEEIKERAKHSKNGKGKSGSGNSGNNDDGAWNDNDDDENVDWDQETNDTEETNNTED